MSIDGFMVFHDQPAFRLEMSRRMREVLVEGLLADGASPAEVEAEGPVLTRIAARFVDALGMEVSADGTSVKVRSV
jgi:hypothetical protein